MPQLIYIILCQKTPLDSNGRHDHSRGYKTILGAYEKLPVANVSVETLFNRFVMEHHHDIETCGVLCGGNNKLSSATATTEEAQYVWSIHEEVLRQDIGLTSSAYVVHQHERHFEIAANGSQSDGEDGFDAISHRRIQNHVSKRLYPEVCLPIPFRSPASEANHHAVGHRWRRCGDKDRVTPKASNSLRF